MNEKNKQYYLYINGEAVPVTEKVYKTFWYFEDKEDYFMRLLKIPRRTQDKETCESVVVPAREVPMDEYSVWCKKNTAPMSKMEDLVLAGIWLEQILETLTEEERGIIREFYINGRTERAACAALGIPRTTFQYREKRLREKLGILLKNFL